MNPNRWGGLGEERRSLPPRLMNPNRWGGLGEERRWLPPRLA
jgi:hypothetical protein